MPRNKDGIYISEREEHGIGKVLGRDKWIHLSALDAITEEEQGLVKRAVKFLPVPLSQDADIIIRVNVKKEFCDVCRIS